MKISLLSDLHLEFFRSEYPKFINSLYSENVDILVLAGDIHYGSKMNEVAELFSKKFKEIIYVAGNHEFYDSSIPTVKTELHKINIPNFHYLDNSLIEINGQRFLGGTMWFKNTIENSYYKDGMGDFHYIQNFTPTVYNENEKFVSFIDENLKEGDIVVTHHLPSYRSVHQRFKHSQLNRFFVCDMERFIKNRSPSYWLYGHTHVSTDYKIENTRIISNPYGYYKYEENSDFDRRKIIEL